MMATDTHPRRLFRIGSTCDYLMASDIIAFRGIIILPSHSN